MKGVATLDCLHSVQHSSGFIKSIGNSAQLLLTRSKQKYKTQKGKKDMDQACDIIDLNYIERLQANCIRSDTDQRLTTWTKHVTKYINYLKRLQNCIWFMKD